MPLNADVNVCLRMIWVLPNTSAPLINLFILYLLCYLNKLYSDDGAGLATMAIAMPGLFWQEQLCLAMEAMKL